MARKRKDADGPRRPDVRLSLRLSYEDHKRLAALALATDRSLTQVLIDAVRPHLRTVRVPWVVGGEPTAELTATGESSSDAA